MSLIGGYLFVDDATEKAVEGASLIRETISNVFEQAPFVVNEIQARAVFRSLQIPVFLTYTERDTTDVAVSRSYA